jgi:hypothetical protein
MRTLKDRLLRLTFWMCRNRIVARGVALGLHFLFTTMSFAIPVQRLRETGTLLAFYHPLPAYPVHILLVPRRAIASLAVLDPARDAAFLSDLITAV